MLLAMAEQAYPPLVSETSQFLSAGSANAFFFEELQLHIGADAAHAWDVFVATIAAYKIWKNLKKSQKKRSYHGGGNNGDVFVATIADKV